MDPRVISKIAAVAGTPFPVLQVYMTIHDLAERYGVSTRTIRRWAEEDVIPLDIDSDLGIRRWDIEELKEFEEDVREQT